MKWEAIECQIFTTVGPAFRANIAEDAKQKAVVMTASNSGEEFDK